MSDTAAAPKGEEDFGTPLFGWCYYKFYKKREAIREMRRQAPAYGPGSEPIELTAAQEAFAMQTL